MFALLVCLAGFGQCENGRCVVVTPTRSAATPAISAAPAEWVSYESNPDQSFLVRGGVTIGGFDFPSGTFRPYFGSGKWGAPAPAPIPPPSVTPNANVFFGVDPNMDPATFAATLNGVPISLKDAADRIGGSCDPVLCDDSTSKHLTVICKSKERAQQIRTEIAAAKNSGDLNHYRVQVYALSNPVDEKMTAALRAALKPDDWTDDPLVILQDPAKNGVGPILRKINGWRGVPAIRKWADTGEETMWRKIVATVAWLGLAIAVWMNGAAVMMIGAYSNLAYWGSWGLVLFVLFCLYMIVLSWRKE